MLSRDGKILKNEAITSSILFCSGVMADLYLKEKSISTMSFNLSQTYRKTICRIAKISEKDFDYYYARAMKNRVSPEDVATVATIIKKLAKKDEKNF